MGKQNASKKTARSNRTQRQDLAQAMHNTLSNKFRRLTKSADRGDKTAAIQIKFYSEHARFPTPQELDKLHKDYVKTYGGITINGKKE